MDSWALIPAISGGHFGLIQEKNLPSSEQEADEGKDMQIQQYQPRLDDTAENDDQWPLSPDSHYFHCIFSKSRLVKLLVPTKMHNVLPKAVVPVILTCQNKSWKMNYYGDRSYQRFDPAGWKIFVKDNKLKVGDGCVFELMECSTDVVKFRVRVLDGEIPPELLDRVDGKSANNPIVIN